MGKNPLFKGKCKKRYNNTRQKVPVIKNNNNCVIPFPAIATPIECRLSLIHSHAVPLFNSSPIP